MIKKSNQIKSKNSNYYSATVLYYEYYTGKKLDLEDPKEFNQKTQWLKIYYRVPLLHQLVDKYAVRTYVSDKIGEKYLNNLIAVYDFPKEVDYEKLPDKFVLKATHGYHFNILVKDKSNLNKIKARLKMEKWLRKDQYTRGGLEWAYKDIKPKFIVEEYLSQIGKDDINDYKFFCFNGKPEFLHVDIDRGKNHSRAYYDMEWNKLPIRHNSIGFIEAETQKPKNFEEMKSVAARLANTFPFVRVDLYNLDGKIIFGEMTFYPADGRLEFLPKEYNVITGNYLKLPKIPKGQRYITNLT